MIAIAHYLINTEHIAYVNLAHTWETEQATYDIVNGFSERTGCFRAKHSGIFVRFGDGSNLTFDDSDPGTAMLRALLTADTDTAERHPHADIALPGYSYNDMAIVAGLPAALQNIITGGR